MFGIRIVGQPEDGFADYAVVRNRDDALIGFAFEMVGGYRWFRDPSGQVCFRIDQQKEAV